MSWLEWLGEQWWIYAVFWFCRSWQKRFENNVFAGRNRMVDRSQQKE